MSARIIPVGAEAAEALALLHAEAFDAPWPAPEFAKLLRTPGAFALVIESEGFCAMLAGWTAADEAEILTLAVAPAARRRGFARDLVRAAMAEAGRRGARALFLEVAADNLAAQALYAALGFEQTGRRRNYYRTAGGPARDALVMRLELAPGGPKLDVPRRRP